MKTRLFNRTGWLPLLAAGALCAPLAAAEPAQPAGCVAPLDALDEHSVLAQASGLALIATDQQLDSIDAHCNERGLAELDIAVQPGQILEMRLQLHQDRLQAVAVGTRGEQADWLEASPAIRLANDAWSVELTINARHLTIPDTRVEQALELTLETADGVLQWQVPIRLLVLEETPLFRNRFEVDPVLGQFSYLAPSGQNFHSR